MQSSLHSWDPMEKRYSANDDGYSFVSPAEKDFGTRAGLSMLEMWVVKSQTGSSVGTAAAYR